MYHMQGPAINHQAGTPTEGLYPGTGIHTPQVDVMESSSEVIYVIEIPGVDYSAVNVEIRDNTLYVEGQENIGIGTDDFNYLYRERQPGIKYSRLLTIPQDVDSEQASASARNGILTVRFPKKATGRRINVNQKHQQQQYQQHQLSHPHPQQEQGH